MRKLWECEDWTLLVDSKCRRGVHLRFDKEVDDEVRRACKEFLQWLRGIYEFPMRVPIYFKATEDLLTMDGRVCSASFWGPFDKTQEPYIRVSVGDYQKMLEKRGKDNALASIIHSIAHELSHYYQWLKDYDFCEEKLERQAKYYAGEILRDYADTREHP